MIYNHYFLIDNFRVMGKGYFSMTLTWQKNCRFIFIDWYTQDVGTFILGCLITMFLAFVSMALPKIRKSIQQKLFDGKKHFQVEVNQNELQSADSNSITAVILTKNQLLLKRWIIPFFYSLTYALLHVVVMIIMMSMNGFVIIAIIVGYTAGYGVFNDSYKMENRKSCAMECHKKQVTPL